MDVVNFGDIIQVYAFEHELGAAFGLPFEREYHIMDEREEGSFYWADTIREAQEVFGRMFAGQEGLRKGAHIVRRKVYPHYAASMDAAWLLVEKLKEMAFWFQASYQTAVFPDDWNKPGYQVTFRCASRDVWPRRGSYTAVAETLPRAICLAAWQIYEAGWVEVKREAQA